MKQRITFCLEYNNIESKSIVLKIIHRSEASYLCCYQKRNCTESIGRYFSTQCLYQKLPEIITEGFKIEQKAKQSIRSLTTSL